MNLDKVKLDLFLPLLLMLIVSVGLNYIVADNLVFYKEQVYTSWEQQQDYSEMLRQEINSKQSLISDLNTQLKVCEIVLVYEKEGGTK